MAIVYFSPYITSIPSFVLSVISLKFARRVDDGNYTKKQLIAFSYVEIIFAIFILIFGLIIVFGIQYPLLSHNMIKLGQLLM